jgi:hypothetical protein
MVGGSTTTTTARVPSSASRTASSFVEYHLAVAWTFGAAKGLLKDLWTLQEHLEHCKNAADKDLRTLRACHRDRVRLVLLIAVNPVLRILSNAVVQTLFIKASLTLRGCLV